MESMPAELSERCDDRDFDNPQLVAEKDGLKFGDKPHSHVTFTVGDKSLARDFTISFSFRSHRPSNGLFLLVKGHTKKFKTHLAASLRDGKLCLDIRERKDARLTMGRTLDDGKWHNVTIIKKFKAISLQVDKERVLEMATRRSLKLRNPLFVGGLPEDLIPIREDIISTSFSGCIRDFHVKGQFVDLAGGMLHSVSECVTRASKRVCM